MASLTPTGSGNLIAGGSLWALIWTVIGHLDTVLRPFGFKRGGISRRIWKWIDAHKILTLCGTEIVNLGHAGLSPLGVLFAIGGTLFNLIMVFAIVPIICWRIDEKERIMERPPFIVKKGA